MTEVQGPACRRGGREARRAMRAAPLALDVRPVNPGMTVLVERVEKFCGEADWLRAYHEINEFEEQLTVGGAIVAKFWLAISPAEQLRRFKERANTPHKQFKITDEDWRNRKKWPQYERAVADMIDRTSTDIAPWNVVASNDKAWARVEALKRLVGVVEGAL